MLAQVKKSRASRAVIVAALVSLGAITVSTSPVVAMEDGARNPNGLYVLGLDPWALVLLPWKLLSLAITLPISGLSGRASYEGQ